jgi:hypothetical protein
MVGARDFSPVHSNHTSLGPFCLCPVHAGSLSLVVKWLGFKANHSCQMPGSKIVELTSTSSCTFVALWLINQAQEQLYLYLK